MPWAELERRLAPLFTREDRAGAALEGTDLFGPAVVTTGAGVSAAGRPRLPLRLMAALLYRKHTHNLSDEELVARWSENIVWQYFSGQEYYEPRLPCDATQLGRSLRDVERETTGLGEEARTALDIWVERAWRIQGQRPHDKAKLYALHAPEMEGIGKGKARKPYEFGVKVGVAVTATSGPMVGAPSFAGNPYDGHILAAQLEQAAILLDNVGQAPKVVATDLGFRGVDDAIVPAQLIHRGKFRTLSKRERKLIRRRSAAEPAIGQVKDDCGLRRCWLKGAEGDALHAVLCAAGYNIRWLAAGGGPLGPLSALFAPPDPGGAIAAHRHQCHPRHGAGRIQPISIC